MIGTGQRQIENSGRRSNLTRLAHSHISASACIWQQWVDLRKLSLRAGERKNLIHSGQRPAFWSVTSTLLPTDMMMLSDRKSTRLNSSHRCISYAVFCLKKK